METTCFYSNSSDIWNRIRGIWMNEILFASFYSDFIHSGGPLCWLCILTFRNTLLYLHFRLSAENLSVESDCKRWNKFHFRCTFLIIKVSCLGGRVFCKVYALKQKGAVAKVKQYIMHWITQLPPLSGGSGPSQRYMPRPADGPASACLCRAFFNYAFHFWLLRRSQRVLKRMTDGT